MSDGHPIVVLLDGEVVIGVFGPYDSEDEAGEHVTIFQNPEMLVRVRPGQNISTSLERLEDPSAFAERVEELLGG